MKFYTNIKRNYLKKTAIIKCSVITFFIKNAQRKSSGSIFNITVKLNFHIIKLNI